MKQAINPQRTVECYIVFSALNFQNLFDKVERKKQQGTIVAQLERGAKRKRSAIRPNNQLIQTKLQQPS